MATKVLTASGAVGTVAEPIEVHSIVLLAGSDAATANLADKATAGGTSIAPLNATAAGLIDRDKYAGKPLGLTTKGYVTLTGTTPTCIVQYTPVKGQ